MAFLDSVSAGEIILMSDTMLGEADNRICKPPRWPDQHRDNRRADPTRRTRLVLVLEDDPAMSDAMREMCDFLDITIEWIDGDADLLPFLQQCRPMAVVAAMDAQGQDGGNVLMTVARHDRSLPVLMVINEDPILAGAADAVTELCGLTEVTQAARWPDPGDLAEFLCHAGVQGRCLALMPI